eukprot:1156600-Pelagomonas_calceolata.AAC.3
MGWPKKPRGSFYQNEAEGSSIIPFYLKAAFEGPSNEDLERVARQFEGDIMQVPPMYSAIKVKGQKLYNLARDGQTVARYVQIWKRNELIPVLDFKATRGELKLSRQGKI